MIKSRYKKIIFFLMMLISFMVTIITILNSSSICYFMPLLPAFNLLGNIIYFTLTKEKDIYIGSLVIFGTYFIRNTITPLVMTLSNYLDEVGYLYNYDETIIYMCIEFLIVSCVVTLFTKRRDKTIQDEVTDFSFFEGNSKIMLIIISLVSIILTLIYPKVLNIFKFGFITGDAMTEHYIEYYRTLNSMPKLIFYLLSWSLTILKELLTVMILLKIKNSRINMKVLASIIVIGINALISTDTLADSLIFSIIYCMIIMDFYKKSFKIVITIVFGGVLLFLIKGLFYDINSTSNILNSLAFTLNAYFGGIKNVAVAFSIQNYNWGEVLCGDFFRSIPIIKALFVNLNNTTTIFNNAGNTSGQIIPAIGQSYMYFGKVLSFLIPTIFSYLTVKYETKLSKETKLINKYLLYILIMRTACVPVLYNAYIFLIGYFGTYLPIKWLSMLDRKNKKGA